MCTRFYAALSPELRSYIENVRKIYIVQQTTWYFTRHITITGEIRPTDMAVVIKPNILGNCVIFI